MISKFPKALLLDRDAVINVSSSNPDSPFYYILESSHFIIKPNVHEALEIIKGMEIPTALVTKQRCIGKGLISRERVAILNTRMERLTDFDFEQIYIEENNDTKSDLFKKVLVDLPHINPQDIWLFDDSEIERTIAARMGFTVFDGTNLYESVCKAFQLK